jgi:type I site-specific restriction endonuclease
MVNILAMDRQSAVAHYRKLGHRFIAEQIDPWYQNVSVDGKIWIATVQSLTHRRNKRIERFKPEDFQLVIFDEAHHGVASSYMRVCDHFGITRRAFEGLFLGVVVNSRTYADFGTEVETELLTKSWIEKQLQI